MIIYIPLLDSYIINHFSHPHLSPGHILGSDTWGKHVRSSWLNHCQLRRKPSNSGCFYMYILYICIYSVYIYILNKYMYIYTLVNWNRALYSLVFHWGEMLFFWPRQFQMSAIRWRSPYFSRLQPGLSCLSLKISIVVAYLIYIHVQSIYAYLIIYMIICYLQISVNIYIYTHVYTYNNICIYISIHIHIYTYSFLHICMFANLHEYKNIYICHMYISTFIDRNVYTHIHLYIYSYIHI